MARIVGIDLPREKRVVIGLTYIYGIGRPTAEKIVAEANVNPDTRVRDLTDDEVARLREQVAKYKTEGDLRRLIEKRGDIRSIGIAEVMTPTPKTISEGALAAEAAHILDMALCNQLLVVDSDNHLIGALHLHDLMTAKVI